MYYLTNFCGGLESLQTDWTSTLQTFRQGSQHQLLLPTQEVCDGLVRRRNRGSLYRGQYQDNTWKLQKPQTRPQQAKTVRFPLWLLRLVKIESMVETLYLAL